MAAAQEATAGRLPAQDSGSRCLLSGADEQPPGAATKGDVRRVQKQALHRKGTSGAGNAESPLPHAQRASAGRDRPAAPLTTALRAAITSRMRPTTATRGNRAA